MADINAALKMEEEALKKMKRSKQGFANSSQLSTIPNPNFQPTSFHGTTSANSHQKSSPVTSSSAAPDLMSFQDISSGETSWSTFEDFSEAGSNRQSHNSAISSVLSLYNTTSSGSLQAPNVLPRSQFRQPGFQGYTLPTSPAFSTMPFHNSLTLPQNTANPFFPQNPSPTARHSHNAAPIQSRLSPQSLSELQNPSTLSEARRPSSEADLSFFQSDFSKLSTSEAEKSFQSNLSMSRHFPRPASMGQMQGMRLDSQSERKKSLLNSPVHSLATAFGDTGAIVTAASSAGAPPRSLSVGSKAEAFGFDKTQSEKLASVFDDWLLDSLSSKTGSPMRDSPSTEIKQPDWLEWDPLNNPADDRSGGKKTEGEDKGSPVPDSVTSEPRDGNFAVRSSKRISRVFSQNEKDGMEGFVDIDETTELQRFAHMVEHLRSGFKHVDDWSNPGHVISHMIECGHRRMNQTSDASDDDGDCTVRISVVADDTGQPVTFECDVNASVEHIVSQALCIAYEDISCVSTDDFCFKVVGRQEYLISKSRLSLYHYVRECRKFDQDVQLELLHRSKVDRSLKRTVEDDERATVAEDFLESLGKPKAICSREEIQTLVEAFYKETELLLDDIKQAPDAPVSPYKPEKVVQAVRAMCVALGALESQDLADTVHRFKMAVQRPPNSPSAGSSLVGDAVTSVEDVPSTTKFIKVRESLEELTSSLLDLVHLYTKAYEVDAYFHTPSRSSVGRGMSRISSTTVKDLYAVNILSMHRVPKQWESTCNEFFVSCSLWYGDKQISHSNTSTKPVKLTKNFFLKAVWKQWVEFDVLVNELPLEVALRLVLHGTSSRDDKVVQKKLAWLSIPLFDHSKILNHRDELFGMWEVSKSGKSDALKSPPTCSSNIHNPDSVVLHVGFSEEKLPTMVVGHGAPELRQRSVEWRSKSDLDASTRNDLEAAVSRARPLAGPIFNLPQSERDLIWEHRLVLAAPDADEGTALSLPTLLQCVPQWSPSLPHLEAAHNLVASWPKALEPEESLALLTSSFPDGVVRRAAIRYLEAAGDMEIASWLPQLVQALRCEQHHDNPITRLLLRRSMGSVRICHHLYWLLNENMWGSPFGDRYTLLHASLLVLCGAAMRKEFERQSYLLKMLDRAAVLVKEGKDSMKTSLLHDDLTKIASRIGGHKFRVSTNPALVANGVNVKNSSFFTSNATPLKVAFTNVEQPGSDICVMYKVGDDLRQDALTMQLVRVMDRMWLSEGLDLRMVAFDCLPTGPNRGMVEIVADAKTFREIQSSYGLTGAFKDRPIAEWLQKYNPTGISYEKAVENFTLSCAGYCVATYVLGICDRHNDNIMLRSSGHLFHIDFARFLGHAQMFGNIKRDRAPFVLTSDMAYVINGGDRPSSKFQHFVDVCCRAFNILRKQSHTIINLLSLMLDCGIPELSGRSDLKYVHDALKPNASATEATTLFTRLIDVSLSSSFTRLNFFIHNLTQMRFLGNDSEEDRGTLSFSPQLHPHKEEEGLITMATVVGYQKRYNPEKHYIYCVKVSRKVAASPVDSYVFRTFDEFEELHRKLSYAPSLQLPSFPNSVVVGRSQVKQVAERRRVKLNLYLSQLLGRSPRNVSMHDLVYTFFHPILRDEEQESDRSARSPELTVGGEVKVSLHYKNHAFYVMVNHCKNLSPVNGADPDPYVKAYLRPDPLRNTKRKTKVARKTLHPTYNEMLVYKMPLEEVTRRKLLLAVWNYESLQENDFMGGVLIDLATEDLTSETSRWYSLKPSL